MDVATTFEACGAVMAEGAVEHFGDPLREGARVLEGRGAWLAPLTRTTFLQVRGGDRAAFLHGQLSSVVQGLGTGERQITLQLDERGRVVGEAVVVAGEDVLDLAVEDGRGAAVRASLERHIVFEDVAIDDLSGELVTLTLQGESAAALLRAVLDVSLDTGGAARPRFGDARFLVLERRRSAAGGFDLHLPKRSLGALLDALLAAGAGLVGERARTLARVHAGIPSAALDAGSGVLPHEIGLETAIAHGKGCYLGQEIMARVEARGAVKRRLGRVRVTEGELVPEALEDRRLWLDGREAGWLGQIARAPAGGQLAMAVVRRDLPDGAVLTVAERTVRLDPAPSPAR